MKIAAIAFSECGAMLIQTIMSYFADEHEIKGYIAERRAKNTPFETFKSVYDLTAELFNNVGALVFIGACGIAVRAAAPLVKSKLTDPAVIVCDETARFAVSLLSGHAGGANKLAEQIAKAIGAVPVITTASDSHAIIEGSVQPRNLVLGIGCRRGLSAEEIERTATILLWDKKIPLIRISKIATIDVKQNEEGLLGFAKAHKLPLFFYSAPELRRVEGDFTASDIVMKAVGVDNVCERAAAICGNNGRMIMQKTAKDGVTVAVFEEETAYG